MLCGDIMVLRLSSCVCSSSSRCCTLRTPLPESQSADVSVSDPFSFCLEPKARTITGTGNEAVAVVNNRVRVREVRESRRKSGGELLCSVFFVAEASHRNGGLAMPVLVVCEERLFDEALKAKSEPLAACWTLPYL